MQVTVIGGGNVDNSKENEALIKEEYISILQWASLEYDKVLERLQRENKLKGLDSYSEEFSYIREERQKKVAALYDKYNLPSNAKFSW